MNRTRIFLLVSNTLVAVLCCALAAVVRDRVLMDSTSDQFLRIYFDFLSVGPLALACLLVVWGPGRIGHRLVGIVAALLLWTMVYSLLWYFGHYSSRVGWARHQGTWPWVRIWLVSLSSVATVCVPLCLWLALLGAASRYRVGPRRVPPLRFHISSLMAATAIVALLVIGNAEIQRQYYLHEYGEYAGRLGDVSNQRLQTMLQVFVASPVLALLIGMAGWSHASHAARVPLFVVGMIVVSLVAYAGMAQSVVIWAVGLGMITVAMWIGLNLFLLGKSGWRTARRDTAGFSMVLAKTSATTNPGRFEWAASRNDDVTK